MKQDITLSEWQSAEHRNPSIPDSIQITLEVSDDRIVIETADGRQIQIELEDGNIRAMAYESKDGKETPVVSIIPPAGEIITSRSDYDAEARPEIDDEVCP